MPGVRQRAGGQRRKVPGLQVIKASRRRPVPVSWGVAVVRPLRGGSRRVQPAGGPGGLRVPGGPLPGWGGPGRRFPRRGLPGLGGPAVGGHGLRARLVSPAATPRIKARCIKTGCIKTRCVIALCVAGPRIGALAGPAPSVAAPGALAPRIRAAGVQAQGVGAPVEVLATAAAGVPRVRRRGQAGARYREIAGVGGRDGPPLAAGLAVVTGGIGLVSVRGVVCRPPLAWPPLVVLVSLSPPPPVPAHPSVPWPGATISPGGCPLARSVSRAPCSSRAAAAWSTTCRRARESLPPRRSAS